ncbi:MAG: hypothetical protein K9I94_13160 [Bacteroidales bacterium]|nr:hypothetical protein [Bacteroidales bacterium]
MSTNELKKYLFEGIENIDDNEFLLTLKELVDRKYDQHKPHKLASWQMERIKESKRQIVRGEFLEDEQVDKLIDQWLEK